MLWLTDFATTNRVSETLDHRLIIIVIAKNYIRYISELRQEFIKNVFELCQTYARMGQEILSRNDVGILSELQYVYLVGGNGSKQ